MKEMFRKKFMRKKSAGSTKNHSAPLRADFKRIQRGTSRLLEPIKFSHEWTVENATIIRAGEGIVSPVFKVDTCSTVWFFGYNSDKDGKRWAGVHKSKTERVDQRDTDRQFMLNIKAIDSNGKQLASTTPREYKMSEFNNTGMVFKDEQVSAFTSKMTFVCNFEMFPLNHQQAQSDSGGVKRASLSDAAVKFITDGPKDITIIGRDPETRKKFQLQVHSRALEARSIVFRAMLKHDTLERKSKKITIQDVQEDELTGMVEFLYTDEVKKLKELALPLLVLADKYEIEPLCDYCASYLSTSINSENVAAILNAADMMNNEKLKNDCLDFLWENSNGCICPEQLEQILRQKPNLTLDFFFRRFKSAKITDTKANERETKSNA